MFDIPIISESKNYWLVRTSGGKYYAEFRTKGFIGMNWENVSLEDIDKLTVDELSYKIKKEFPDKPSPGHAANQLRIFKNQIKKGDTVVITGYGSNKFSIGEVTEDECYFEEVTKEAIEANPKLCPHQKRKKVKWIKEVHKWDVDMPMFKLLQHAQHTITDANEYKDVIESMVNNFYIRGDYAQLSLSVKKEGNIPVTSFFELGKEILDLAKDFNDFSENYYIDLDTIETMINVNSPGKIKFKGPMTFVLAFGILIVGVAGGGVKLKTPSNSEPGNYELTTNGVISEISTFLNQQQSRKHKDVILNQYLDELDVNTPDELIKLLDAVNAPD